MKTPNCVFASISRSLKPASFLVGLVLLVTGLWLTGCQPDTSVSKKPDYTGTYILATINGNQLPFAPPHQGGVPQVKSGVITLNANGTFTSVMSYASPDGRSRSRDFSGSYTSDGTRLRLKWQGAGVTSATVEGNTFTMDNEGVLFAYRK